ncbi:amino acid transporter [Aureobasidium subglaciale]|nr:amino acid transporter [Aureobasidium subglaciale]
MSNQDARLRNNVAKVGSRLKVDSARSSSNDAVSSHEIVSTSGDLKFVVEQGGNGSQPSYQEVSGAPVESKSSLGYAVGPVTIVLINISKMIGTGVYSTPATILKGTGSVGTSLIFWALGLLTSGTSLAVYLEYASYFPNRSGSEVVYLEQAFPRPKYFFPIAFAVQTVILSFSSGNAIVMAQYLFKIGDHTPSAWEQKGVAIACYTLVTLLLIFHTKTSYRISNAIGIIKVLTLIFIALTGLVVLGGHTRVQDPKANFRNAFEGKASGYGLTNSLVKIIFSYAGYENAFNIVNEIQNPVKTIKRNASYSLIVVTILYLLANIAYFAAVPKLEIMESGTTVASLFFTHVFGHAKGVKAFNLLIALSAFGNLIAVQIGQSRLIRECGRQGVLPWPRFWASTRPFGTPIGPYAVKWGVTIIMILAPPAGDAFAFITDLQIYPASAFAFAMAIGLYIVRYRRKKLGVPKSEFRAWDAAVIFTILQNLYLLIMPWYPPDGGATGGDVSFWYATYCVAGIGILLLCGVYYYSWLYLLPKLGKYQVKQEVIVLEDGSSTNSLVRVPLDQLEKWNQDHDAAGRVVVAGIRVEAKSEGRSEQLFPGCNTHNASTSIHIMSDEEIVAGAPGATSLDARGSELKPKYRSWRKKYRKMKTHFDDVMKESNSLFVEEQKLEVLSKRLQEQNDQLLDLLLDLNTSLSIPQELRVDLSPAPKTQQPQDERDITFEMANNIIANAHRAFHNHEVPHQDFVRIRQDIESLLARKDAKSLVEMEAQIPHPRYHHPISALVAEADPAFLSSSHEDAYLARLDNKLEPTAPLSEPRIPSPQPLSKLTQRELDREVELRNPLSVHNWLKKHGTISDIDAASEGGANAQTPATANRRRNLAKQIGDKALERAREKEGSPGSTVDNEEGAAAAVTGGDDTPGKPKKAREDDQTYRPKGGRSKSKRKRDEGENTPARGKKQRTSLNIPSDA